MDSYITLKGFAEAEYTVKHSRFIGYAAPVTTEAEARDFLEGIRKKHRDATHNVYAYTLRENNTRRFSDDGEPSGTAGMPVLDVLGKSGTLDAVIVVTRYFGGILLGAGGLVRAYSHTAALAVTAAGSGEMTLLSLMKAECDYSFYNRLAQLIPEQGGKITSVDYTDGVCVSFSIRSSLEQSVCSAVTESSNGKVVCEKTGELYGIAD